jgi:hypothetical protein
MVTWVGKASVNQAKKTGKNDELVKNRNKWLCRENEPEKPKWYYFMMFLKPRTCPGILSKAVPMFFEEGGA